MGRRQDRWTAAYARTVLDEWKSSGESSTAFARRLGVSAQRLLWWRARLAEAESGGRSSLVPVVVRATASACPILVTTPTGVRIEINEVDASTSTWVAAVLGERGPA
jgi:transposase-like protein